MSPADTADQGVDPVTLEVVRNACEAVCEEMNATLVRTAYSPNITERRDCSCALFDATGQLIAQAETMPVHLGAMPFSVGAALERFPPETLAPGDTIALNDPYHGGAHLPDVTLVSPVFRDPDDESSGTDTDANRTGSFPSGESAPIAFVANRAHHADIGGAHAGSVAADSTEIYQEGLRLPPVKLTRGGTPNESILDVIAANVRIPGERRGDLRAQQAANATGSRRYRDLCDRYGQTNLDDVLSAITAYSERRMRAELRDLPDGSATFVDYLDDDGCGTTDVRIEVTVQIDADEVTVDFAGTAPQTPGPVNAVFAVTASATYYALRCLSDPDIPPNAGCYRPISIEVPEESVVNPSQPAAVVGGNVETSQRITDVVLGALAEIVPERAVAGCQGTMNNVTVGGQDSRDNSPFTFYETQAGGFGGRADADGMDAVHVHMSNTLNTPVEVLETAYPLRVRRYELRPDSCGAGEYRGGLGIRRDLEVCTDRATVSLLADRHRYAPYGLAGGEAGSPGSAVVFGAGNDRERIPAKCVRVLSKGDVLSVRTPGGGGYGDPDDRPRDAVERDLRRGILTAETAQAQYGYESDEDD